MVKVKLLEETPLVVSSLSTRTCWESYDKSDSKGMNIGQKDVELLTRVSKKFKHRSILEHLNIFLNITDITIEDMDTIDWLMENQYVIIRNNIYIINARVILEHMFTLKDIIYQLKDSEIINFLVDKKIHPQFPNYLIWECGIVEKIKNSTDRDHTSLPLRRKTYIDRYGYVSLKLKDIDRKSRSKTIHRLLGECFIDNQDPENKTQINHIDGIKTNNSLGNLEWVTPSENEKHSYDVLGKIPYNRGKKLPSGYDYQGTIRTVGQYDLNDNLIKEWFNPTIAELEGGFSSKLISSCALGIQKTHKGFKWKYLKDDK